jgi:hypothetical protein
MDSSTPYQKIGESIDRAIRFGLKVVSLINTINFEPKFLKI